MRRSLRILYVGWETIGLYIREVFSEKGFRDEFDMAFSVREGVARIREPGCHFDLILAKNLVDRETGSAQEMIRAVRELSLDTKIIQIGSYSAKREVFPYSADAICETSSDLTELLETIDHFFPA